MRPVLALAARRAFHLALPVLALALGPACLSVTPPGSAFATEPPGARVMIDGQDSGWVTPCQIALDLDRTHQVSLELDGYAPFALELVPSYRRNVVDWYLGATGNASTRRGGQSTIRFPLFLPTQDLIYPFRVNKALLPARVFARLRPQDGT